MYWYKVKTLLIGLFAAINIFLIVFIVNGKIQQSVYERNETKALLEVLKINGIEAAESVLPSKSKAVKTAAVENLTPDGEEIAKMLLGETYEAVSEENGTIKYVVGDKTAWSVGGKFGYKDNSAIADTNLNKDSVNFAKNVLSGLGIDTSFTKSEIVEDKIVFTYYFNNLPLFESNLYMKVSDGKVAELGGYIIGINEVDDEKTEVASPNDALARFLRDAKRGEEKQKIVSLSLGYSVLLADSSVHFKNTETIPTYKIVTDKNRVFYYDAR